MPPLADWLPCALVGVTMTLFGLAKFYGLWRGIVGGRDKPLCDYICGT